MAEEQLVDIYPEIKNNKNENSVLHSNICNNINNLL